MVTSSRHCHDGPVRILVVEDDAALGSVVRRGLIEEGHAVDLAPTFREAEYASSIESYDVVVLDLGLPDGDGVDLCRMLRERSDPARVLMLTARDAVADRVVGLDAGADDYLPKPFAFPELAARVRALLRRTETTVSPILELGDIRLDPAAHRVEQDGTTVPLTPKEFGLLHYLLSRPGEVIDRSTLLDHVWDAHYDGLSNVVDVHMASLRRKLDLAGESGLVRLETVRGVGYRLSAADWTPSR